MDFADTMEERGFRERLRTWLAEHAPERGLPHGDDAHAGAVIRWQRKLHEAGWSGLSVPREYGGGGFPPTFEGILSEELGAAGAPPILDSVYLSHVVLAFGTEEQKRRWVPRMVSGEDWWCQGFSEPGAGSDLAALATTAVREGDDWVISGQKTWTTSGQWATHCLLLARTDREVPRHEGITAFVVPMDSKGLLRRPIRQSSGRSEFSELFLDEVRVPDAARLGALGGGWSLAMATVTLERGPADNGYAAKHRALLERLEAAAVREGRGEADRLALARAYVDVEVLRIRIQMSLGDRAADGQVGPESSADKLLMIQAEQGLHHLALHLAGSRAALPLEPDWLDGYLFSRAAGVYGGTEQIQRTILAQRVLGLPRA